MIFEGRDAAGKGGTIKRITEPLNPRGARVVALRHAVGPREDAVVLPALRRAPAGGRRDRDLRPQLVQPRRRRARLGFCTEAEYTRLSCAPAPSSSGMLVRSGIILLKYWFSVSDAEQERRFQERRRTR